MYIDGQKSISRAKQMKGICCGLGELHVFFSTSTLIFSSSFMIPSDPSSQLKSHKMQGDLHEFTTPRSREASKDDFADQPKNARKPLSGPSHKRTAARGQNLVNNDMISVSPRNIWGFPKGTRLLGFLQGKVS